MKLTEEQREGLARLVRRGMIRALREMGLLTESERQALLADER